jgi:hypothetical protein
MPNQPQSVTLTRPRQYARTDFAALRAVVQRIAPTAIARRYNRRRGWSMRNHVSSPGCLLVSGMAYWLINIS